MMKKWLLPLLIILPINLLAAGAPSNEITLLEADPNYRTAVVEIDALKADCEKKPQDEKVECNTEGLEKLSENGNFLAQHYLGIAYYYDDKKEEAAKLFQQSFDNPKTPVVYKEKIERHRKELFP